MAKDVRPGGTGNLLGRAALVTAGSRGLGAGIVRELAAQGADVAFTFAQDRQAADEIKRHLAMLGRRAYALRADARDFKRAEKVVTQVHDKLGRLDILVCNAGAPRSAPIWKMTEEDWDEAIGLTLKSAFNYVRAIAPILREQRSGKIVCIGSINGLRGRIGTTSYNTAKAGLVGLVKTVAAELGPYNVNANLVAPGFIETPSQANTPELIRDLVVKETVLRRLGSVEDIAPVVAFLCSEGARHVTGQVIKVDGGQYL